MPKENAIQCLPAINYGSEPEHKTQVAKKEKKKKRKEACSVPLLEINTTINTKVNEMIKQ